MGGDQALFILVMVVLAVVLVGTFVLRPSISTMSGHDARTFYYVVRIGIVLAALMYRLHQSPHRASDSFIAQTPPSTAGPKTMEFHWSATTQQSQ